MTAVAAYLRVSTRAQDHEPQRLALARFAPAVEYVDTASGKTARRPGLDRLLADCRAGRVGTVVVARLDRLGRSVRDVCNVAHELEGLGVRLVVADQGGMDTGTPAGRLLFHVLAAVGEMERSLIVERVRSGLEVARAEGRRLGRRPALEGGKLTRARALRASGQSWRAIAREVGVSVRSVRRALAA